MSIERYLRLIAGFFVMLSVALGYWINPAWFLFTAFALRPFLRQSRILTPTVPCK
jgi:hypothetical protein